MASTQRTGGQKYLHGRLVFNCHHFPCRGYYTYFSRKNQVQIGILTEFGLFSLEQRVIDIPVFLRYNKENKETDSFIYRDSCPDAPFVDKSHESSEDTWVFFMLRQRKTSGG